MQSNALTPHQHVANFKQLEALFWKSLSIQSQQFPNGIACYLSENKGLGFNYLFVHDTASVAALQQGIAFFAQHQAEYILVCESDLTELLDEIQRLSFEDDGRTTAMQLDLNLVQPQINQNHALTIRMVNQQLDLWANPLQTAFPVGDVDLIPCLIRAHQRALDQNIEMYHFVLEDQGQPLTALTLSIDQEIARLDDIGTNVAFQGKGYATQLIQHALAFAQQHGVKYCYLEASEQGLAIYQKIGFKALFNNENFVQVHLE